MARPEAAGRAGRPRGAAADEQVLITDETGEILETDKANVFAVIDGVLLTPPADGRLLPGTTRAAVMRAARGHGIRVGQKPLTLDELASASEVFVTNAVVGVLPVTAVDGCPASWRSGQVIATLAAALTARPPDPRPAPPAPPTSVTRATRVAPRPAATPPAAGRRSSSSTTTTRSPGTSRTSCPSAARESRWSATTR